MEGIETHSPDEALEQLLQVSAMTLSTVGQDGEPHAAPVYFVAIQGASANLPSDWTLYFFSSANSQHTMDAAIDPRAAAALYPECQGWQDIRGLQMRGYIRLVEAGSEWDLAWQRYCAKFPFVSQLKDILTANLLFAFSPHWIRLVDNRRGFGFKKEWGSLRSHNGEQ